MYRQYQHAYREDAIAILAGKIPLNVVCHMGTSRPDCSKAVHIYAVYKGSTDLQVWFGCQKEKDSHMWDKYFHGTIKPNKIVIRGAVR